MPLAKRRLTDLFMLGRLLIFDDGQMEEVDGEMVPSPPISVWAQKFVPIEQTEASRHADAARARYLAVKSHPESDEYQQVLNAVLTFNGDLEQMAAFILGEERQKAKLSVHARISSAEEWSKDNYLQGLYDSWNDPDTPLKARWVTDTEDPEAKRVFEELNRFNEEVDAGVDEEMQPFMDAKMQEPFDDLQHQMVNRMIELDASQQWMDEYEKWQFYLCTRDPDDHKKKYFLNRAEVDGLSGEVIRLLRDAFSELEVENAEGKSSPGTPPSSPSSEPSVEEETEQLSGQLVSTP